MHHQILPRYITFNSYTTNYRYRSSDKVITSTSNLGLIDQVEGDYVQTSPPASNEWHYVRISKKKENVFTWKNKAGVEWDLVLSGDESGGRVTFKVRKTKTKTKTKTMTMTMTKTMTNTKP